MSPTYDTALAMLRDRLAAKHVEHSERTAETAASLASRYGLDASHARLAGLLHDWSREADAEDLFSEAEERGVPVSAVDREVPYLLHARIGALILAEDVPDLPRDVIEAVERHTLGRPDMGPLDKVVFVADMIEPGRVYPGVDALRHAAATVSLDELFREAYAATIEHLVERRRPIHPLAVDVWNELVAEVRA